MRFRDYLDPDSVLLYAFSILLITMSGCGAAWMFKAEKVKSCPVERSESVKYHIQNLEKALDEFKREL